MPNRTTPTKTTEARSDRFQAAHARAVETFLGIGRVEGGRPTFCSTETEAYEPGLLDAVDDADTIVDELAQLCGWTP